MIFHGQTIEGEPAANWPLIQKESAKYPKFTVEVHKYDEQREISNQQMAYLHTVVFETIAKHMHSSLWEAEFLCKTQCGEQWFVKKMGDLRFVLSKTTLTVKQCNKWIENIQDWGQRNNIFIPAPDKDWRKAKKGEF